MFQPSPYNTTHLPSLLSFSHTYFPFSNLMHILLIYIIYYRHVFNFVVCASCYEVEAP